MATANLAVSCFLCLFCVCFVGIPFMIIWRCVYNIANEENHWRAWNTTIHRVDYTCNTRNQAVCCHCPLFTFGHCCERRAQLATFHTSELLSCMRTKCPMENDQKWWYIVGIVFCGFFEAVALLFVMCILCNSYKQGKLTRCCRRCRGLSEEETADIYMVQIDQPSSDTINSTIQQTNLSLQNSGIPQNQIVATEQK